MLLNIFRTIFDWSEVWALLIPLAILIIYKPKRKWITAVKWYLIVALLLGIVIDFYWYVNKNEWFEVRKIKKNYWDNNKFYNLQSISRLLFFSWFFALQGSYFKRITRVVPVLFLSFAIILFVFFKPFTLLSSHLMATEAGLLLVYCLLYTYKVITDDKPIFSTNHPPHWVVGGLTLYTAVNFFIFLFYNYLMNLSLQSAKIKVYVVGVWDVHNVLLIILCISIAIAFYNERDRK
jgi:hypothetical protein